MRTDVHQHIWTEPLIQALSGRTELPFIRHGDGLTVLHCAGERPYVIDVAGERPELRARLLREERLELALIALSSPVGIEALPREEALPLIDAHLTGVGELGDGFAAWGPLTLDQAEPDDVDDLLARGCVGISVPAGAMADRGALDVWGPVLERIASRQVPVLVHPGPAPGRLSRDGSRDEPLWWRPLTDYVAQMQAAWLTFSAIGRREHPELMLAFALLAGCAPLQAERLAARGGPRLDLSNSKVFYDTSSYGAAAIDAVGRLVGWEQLVYGSDRPVVEPVPSDRDELFQANGARLVGRIGAPA